MIFVVAPDQQQASFWLHEFGTPRNNHNVHVITLPLRLDRTGDHRGSLPAQTRGLRWQHGDEFLIVGDPTRIDSLDLQETVKYLNIPDDIVDRELEANQPL